MKTIDEQILAMAAQWPEFAVTERTDTSATWEGPLAPDGRKHLVRVRYRVPFVLENISLKNAQPRVQVIEPQLERHFDYELGPTPHVYVNSTDKTLPYLCLFSPELRQWSGCDLIADTTMFWAYEWLWFYEGWLTIWKWRGGGRHPSPEPDEGAKQLETV
jgi:hypothetical protein